MADNSLERMLAVLDLFQESRLEWAPEEMIEALGYSRSTLYRYLKMLSDAGLVTSLPNRGYTLGPRVIELDYLIRNSDPVIVAGRPLLVQLAARFPGTALIVRRFKDKVLCVHHEQSRQDARSSYARGRPMPISRGATARAILAFLPRQQLVPIIEANLRDFSDVGLGASLEQVLQNLRKTRRDGYAIAHGEVTPGVYGIAAPVFDAGNAVVASVCMTIEDRRVGPEVLSTISEHIKFSASVLSTALAERDHETQRVVGS